MGAACTNQVEDAIPVSDQPIEFSVQSDWKEIPNTRSNDGKTPDKNIQEAIITPYQNQPTIVDATVFILPDKITGLKLTKDDGTEIDASEKIKEYTFEAGKLYDLTISKGVQKNTNTRSIAMSVRCVSK